ncbi:serine/threonine-protein kinase VRK1-like isoform X2 [Stegodyphus dumicola]|uniref:serine/threonine-protein kinase VRK1-like isoform X2 n=1 Tax=Stegodyphus dumicola TaxID=202533 RepID=UPI0015AAF966|nr:serine/threonine-protein kinase VRK1-like isoform X2 [Stegodyphus dumicola]
MAGAAKKVPRQKAAKGHKLPEPIPEGFAVSDTTKKSWVFGKKIGSGGFGTVYFAAESNNPKNFDYVIKVEYHGNGPLFAEMHCYQKIGKPEHLKTWIKEKKLDYLGLSPCHGFGSFEFNNSKYRFMVLERFDKDLQQLLNDNGKTFPVKTVCLIGLSVVYLVDMGLACKYQREGVHKKDLPDVKKAHNGTPEFTSRDAHRGSFSRRSDLEVLCYNLLQWLCGELPWEHCISDNNKLQREKEQCMANLDEFLEKLFPDGDCPDGIAKLLQYVCDLDFDEAPDYNLCRKFLKDELKKKGCDKDSLLIFKKMVKKPATKADASKQVSNKENTVRTTRSTQTKRKQTTSVSLDPSIIPTPAMLELLQKKDMKPKGRQITKKAK